MALGLTQTYFISKVSILFHKYPQFLFRKSVVIFIRDTPFVNARNTKYANMYAGCFFTVQYASNSSFRRQFIDWNFKKLVCLGHLYKSEKIDSSIIHTIKLQNIRTYMSDASALSSMPATVHSGASLLIEILKKIVCLGCLYKSEKIDCTIIHTFKNIGICIPALNSQIIVPKWLRNEN